MESRWSRDEDGVRDATEKTETSRDGDETKRCRRRRRRRRRDIEDGDEDGV